MSLVVTLNIINADSTHIVIDANNQSIRNEPAINLLVDVNLL